MSMIDSMLLDPVESEMWIAIRTDGARGSGTARDPFNGSTADAFDFAMRKIAQRGIPVRVHLGPGTFQTHGYTDADPGAGWQAAPRMAIAGSGIGATTLKLVNMSETSAQYFAVGHQLCISEASQGVQADFFEIADLTIDCGLNEAPANCAAGAVRVKGNHSRIRRVKAINWGSKNASFRAYVFAAIVADSKADPPFNRSIFDSVIEECSVVQPATGTNENVTLLFTGKAPLSTVYACGESCVIRNCFIDAHGAEEKAIRALGVNWCHGAIVEDNFISNVWHGGPANEGNYTVREVIVRNNIYRNVRTGPLLAHDINGSPDDGEFSVLSAELMPDRQSHSLKWADIKTDKEHFVYAGDWVKLIGPTPLHYSVTNIRSPKHFVVNGFPTAPPFPEYTSAKKLGAIHKLQVEGNTFEFAPSIAPSEQLTGVTYLQAGYESIGGLIGEVIIRGNQFRYLDGMAGTSNVRAISVTGARGAVISDNLIDITPVSGAPVEIGTVTGRFIGNRHYEWTTRPSTVEWRIR